MAKYRKISTLCLVPPIRESNTFKPLKKKKCVDFNVAVHLNTYSSIYLQHQAHVESGFLFLNLKNSHNKLKINQQSISPEGEKNPYRTNQIKPEFFKTGEPSL